MSVVALDRLGALRARANAMIDANRAAYRKYWDIIRAGAGSSGSGHDGVSALREGDGDVLFDVLKTHYDTSVVPGRFFGCADRCA